MTKTATETPEAWANFEPPKFCGGHRHAARRAGGHKGGVLAAAWRATPEGKASMRQRMGSVQRLAYAATGVLSLADGFTDAGAVLDMVEGQMPPAPAGKRDMRRYQAHRAVTDLIARGLLCYRDGRLWLSEEAKHQPSPPGAP